MPKTPVFLGPNASSGHSLPTKNEPICHWLENQVGKSESTTITFYSKGALQKLPYQKLTAWQKIKSPATLALPGATHPC
jgi:hypothetical protein